MKRSKTLGSRIDGQCPVPVQTALEEEVSTAICAEIINRFVDGSGTNDEAVVMALLRIAIDGAGEVMGPEVRDRVIHSLLEQDKRERGIVMAPLMRMHQA